MMGQDLKLGHLTPGPVFLTIMPYLNTVLGPQLLVFLINTQLWIQTSPAPGWHLSVPWHGLSLLLEGQSSVLECGSLATSLTAEFSRGAAPSCGWGFPGKANVLPSAPLQLTVCWAVRGWVDSVGKEHEFGVRPVGPYSRPGIIIEPLFSHL